MTLFPRQATRIEPRPYQIEAIEALDNHLCTRDSNPCVVIPTGGGKSIVIAWAIRRWKLDHPPLRTIILAHRQELVEQNSQEMLDCWPEADVGVYSAGLGKKQTRQSILYASIDSVYKLGGTLEPFDVVIVDEAHRIPARGEGKYREFLHLAKLNNKNLRVVGFTATPYRMGCGPICHRDHILNEVCYEANVGSLIRDGYLCKLRSKLGHTQPDLSGVRRNAGGDYIVNSLAASVNKADVVSAAVTEAVAIIAAENRKSAVFFCVDVEHCKRVSRELANYGIEAPYVTANTHHRDRDRIASDFKKGRYRALCNVNVYTEGFNAKQVDCIVLLRPTLSKGLFVQMCGRGLRLHPDKSDCLILDYAHCIEEHGPIDCIDAGEVRIAVCGGCGDVFSRAVRTCPNCGWSIPKEVIEKEAAEEAERKLHAARASQASILSGEPEELPVNDVQVHRHVKDGSPDSLRVEYRCGMLVIREWVCLDHPGMAGQKAHQWWARRFGKPAPGVGDALSNMFLAGMIRDITESVTVVQRGKFKNIVSHKLKAKNVVQFA